MPNIKTATVLPADPEGMNDDRAEWAQNALDAFASVTSMDTAGEDAETILTDLLADLMHWSDRNGVKFSNVLACAQSHYCEETIVQDDMKTNTCGDCSAEVQEVIGCHDGSEVCESCFDNH